ncbi:YadA-like family protein [Fusobacterium pseudoperiodonticum]|nr:YadA-like family protein [Fusobacterium pseudoperiodonticum]
MNNKERDEKFLKSWLKKKISITTSTVVSFLITGAIGGGTAYGVNNPGTGGNDAVAIGTGSTTTGDGVAVGANANATSATSGGVTSKGVAIGNDAKAKGSVSVGDSASSNYFGVAVGYKAGAENTTTGFSYSNVTIGSNTRVGVQGTQASQGIAIGSGVLADQGAWAKGDQSISIGGNTIASGDSSIAIGGDDLRAVSTKTSSYSDAKFDKNGNKIGGNSNNTASINNIFNTLTGRGAILHGGTGTDGTKYAQWRNTESGQGGVALGVKSLSGDIALAIGTFSEATGTNSVAIGTGAQTPQSGAVSIGGGSTTYGLQGRQITDADITLTDGTTMALTNFAGASGVFEGSMVSFGKVGNERQLKNIAPGEVSATSTDGINGSQLFAVAKKLGDDISKFKYVSIKSNDAGNKLNDGATANNAIAIGPNASTKVESAVSLGDGANVLPGPTKDKAGTLLQTVISSGSGVAIGKNATATQAGVAIGDTSSTVTSGIAIGREAKVTNKYEAASGPYVVGDSQDGYLNYDRVQNPDNLQYSKTEATGNNIFSPDRYNGQGIAIGYKAESNMFGTSLGNSAVAKQGGLALGTFSRAEGATATAIGLGANSSGARGISMGRQASATTEDSVAIGTGARGGASSAGGSVAIGGGAAATGTQAIAIGGLYGNDLYSSSATKDGAGNLTKNTQASGAGSIAMGVNAVADKDNALALGGSTQVFKNEDVALGYGSKVTSAPTSVTSATVGGVTYGGFAGTNPSSSLSIGSAGNERQIKNVAAGEISATSTDAINGSQLYSVTEKLSQGWIATADGNKIGAATPTAVKPGNTVVYSAGSNLQVKQTIDATNGKQTYEYSLNKDLTGLDSVTTKKLTVPGATPGTNDVVIGKDGINAGSKPITNVAPGVNGTDAVNKNQLDKIGDNEIKLGGNSGTTAGQKLSQNNGLKFNIVGANGIETSASGTDVTVKLDTVTKQKIDKAVLPLKFSGDDYDPFDEVNTTIAKGLGERLEIVGGATDLAKGIPNVGTFKNSHGQLEIGLAKSLTGLKAAQFLSDPDNPDKGYSTITGDGYTITPVDAGGNVLPEISITKDGIDAGNTVIKNVGPGQNPTDAVNVSQLNQKIGDNKIKLGGDTGTTATQDLSKAGGLQFNVVGTTDEIVTVASGDQVKVGLAQAVKDNIDNKANKDLSNLTPTGIDKIKDTAAWKVKANSNAAETVKGGDEVVFKDGAGVTITQSGKEFTISADTSKISKDTKISYTANGDAPKKEVSLADGFNFENGTLTTASVDTAGKVKYDVKTTTLTSTDGKVTVPTTDGVATAKDVANAINNSGWKANAGGNVDGTSASTLVKVGDEVVFKAGDNLTVKQDLTAGKQEYTYKLNKDLTGLDSVTSKTITVPGAPGTNDVVIGKDGINAGNKPITNVADGVNGKDAVNKSQLDKIGDNEIKLGGDNTTVTAGQKLSKTGGLQFNIKGANGIETSAAGTDVTVKLDAATRGKIDNAADKNLSNLTPAGIDKIKDTAAWKVKANSNAAETVKGGDEVVFKDGAGVTITQSGKEFTISADTSKISKDTKISYTANGDAPKKEVSLADGFNFENGTLTTASVDTAGKVKYDVKTTTLTSTDGKVTVPTTDGVATAKDVANAINNSGWKANAGGNVDGTSASTLVKVGDEVVFKAGDNLTVKQDLTAGKQEYTYKLNKDLTGLDSVTSKTITVPGAPGTNDVVIGKDGINAGNKPITNVADGVNGKDAVNKSQLDKIGDNEIKLGGDNTTVTAGQKLSKTGGLQFNIKGANGIETSAAGTDVTVKLDAATRGKIDNAADKNLSNLTPAGIDKIKDTAAWKVKANNNTAETVKGGDEVVFKDGAGVTITQNGKEFTIAADTSKISKDTKISYTANGAAPKKEVSLADGFNFEDGTLTTASVDTAGKVKYDVKTTTLTSTDGKVTVPTTDGVATAKDVANAINNSGWKANAGGNVDGTSASTLVKAGDEVVFKAGDNLTVKQDLTAGKQEYTYKLNKDLTGLDSVTSKTITVPGAPGTNDVVIGKDGISAGNKVIKDVAPGVNGTDAVNKNQLDTTANNLINKGMNFSADDYDPATANTTVSKKLGERLEIVGGADKTKLSDNNIGSVVDNTGKINVKLAKELKDLTSAEFKTPAGDKTVINGDGLTVTPGAPGAAPISVTKDGINAGNKTITNVAPGVNGTDAVNKNQLDQKIGDNKIKLGGDTGTTATQDLSKAGGLQFNVVGTTDEIVTVASGDQVKVGLAQAVKDNIDNKANKDLSNLTPTGIDKIKDTAAWKVKANSNAAETVKGGDEVVFKDGAGVTITQSGKEFTISADTTKISQGTKLSYTANGDAPKQEVTLADGLNFKNGNFTTATVGANGEVKYDTVTQGLTVTDGKAGLPNPATPGGTTPNGLVTAQDVSDALNNVGWKATADATGTGAKTGTPSAQLVKNGSTVSYVAGDNLTVAQDVTAGDHKYTYSLNKVLKDLTSAEFKTPAGDKTVINGDGLTVSPATPTTSPISVTKDGISAGDKKVTNVAPGTISKTSTDAINGSQLYNLASNTIQLGGDNASTTDKQTLDKSGGIKFDIVGANGITTEAKDGKVTVKVDSSTIGSNSKLKYTANGDAPKQEVTLADGLNFKNGNFTTATVGANGEVKYDTVTQGLTVTDGKAGLPNPATPGTTTPNGLVTAQDVADALNNVGWKANAGGNVDGTPTSTLVKAGDEVVFKAGDNLTVKQDLTAGKQEYTYKLNKDLTGLDSVTSKTITVPGAPGTNDVVIGKDGISAGNKVIKDVAPGVNGTDAVNKNQLDTTANNLINKGMNFSADDYDPATANTTVSKKLGERLEIVGGADKTKLSNDNIGSVVDNTGKINVKLAKELKDLTSAEFKTPAGDKTVINGDGLTVSPATPTTSPISVTKDGISAGDKKVTNVAPGTISKTSTDAVNGSQLYNLSSNTIQLGGDNASTTDKQTLDKTGGIKFDIVGANGITTEAKDGKVTVKVDSSTIGSNSKLKYTANGDAPKQEVTLADGLNFKNGNFTTATVGANGEVKYDTVTQGLTVTDGKAGLPNPATPGTTTPNGLVTAQDVADALNNVGWKANAGGNVDGTPTSTLVKAGDEVVFKAGDNLTVKQDLTAGKQEYTYKLNKDLTGLDSVTSKTITVPGAPGTNDVVIGKDGISAGNKVIKDVAPGVNGTDAVNKNQLDTTANNLINKGMNFSADDYDPATANTTVSKKLGERLEIVGGADKTKLSNDNIGSVVDNTGKINVKLAKELKDLTSAEFKTPAGDKTVINGDGLTVSPATPTTSPISVTKDGISAGDKKVTNVAPGTISKTSTDAVNGSQLYNLSSNTIQLGGDNASTTDKQTLDKTGGIKFDIVGANGITTEAKDGKVTVKVDSSTIGSNSKLKYTANGDAPKQEVTLADGLNFKNGNFTTATVGANGEVKYDTVTQGLTVTDGKAGLPNPATPGGTTPNGLVTAQDVADALNNVGWKANAGGNVDGTSASTLVKAGDEVVFKAGDNLTVKQDLTAGKQEYTYKLNKDLTGLDSVTSKTITVPGAPGTNDVVIGKDGISAGNKVIKDVAPGVNGTDAVNKNQLDTTANNLINKGMNFSADDYDPATANTTVSKKLGERLEIVGGADKTKLSNDNIGSVVDNTGKINVKLAKELKDLTSAEFKTPAGDKTVINGDGLTVSPATPTTSPISVTKDGISAGDKKVTNVAPGTISKTSTDAINGSQLYNLSSNTIQLGGDKATTTDKQTLDKNGGIKFDIVGANGITTEAKDGKVTVSVDASTIGANTKLKYKSNSDAATAQEVKLSDGLDFKNGNFTTATVGANGEVKYDTVTQTLSVSPDGKASLPNPATPGATTPNGLVTAQDVANALNSVGWNATASAVGTGVASGSPSAQLVKNGSTVSYVAGDNLTVAQDVTAGDHKYTYSLNKVLKDLTSAEFKTPAGDKTVINGDGLTVSPATPTTSPISVTKDGISAGDKVVKNVAPGAISKTSTDAINGSQLYNLASNTIQLGGDKATTTDKQTLDNAGGIKFDIVGANGITTEAKDGKVTVKVDAATIGANTKLKYKSNSDAATSQEVKLSDGLDFKNGNFTTATVGANGEVKYDTVTQGLSVSPDGKASLPNPATPGATTPNGLVTAQDVANALNSVGWNATASAVGTGVASGSPSAQLVKNGSTVSYVAGDNLTVAQDVTAGDHKYTYSLNKVLKDLTSAEFKTAAGDKTVINGDGLTVSPATPGTAPISITKDGISAGDKVVKNVAPGTISSTSTDAINGSQFHKLATNTIQLGGDNATTTATQQLDKNGGIKFNIVGENGITTKATGDKVSIGVDTSTIGANIKLKYKSNSDAATAQEVKLSDGLDFKNGNFTTATVGANGEVKYDTVTQGLSVSPDGKASLPNPATPGATTPNGLVTAQDVANALNSVGWNATASAVGTGVASGSPSAQLVKNGSTVSYVAGDNLTVAQDVTAGDHKYTYSLNKQLKDLTSAEFVNPTSGNKTVVNGDGLTITPSTPGAKNISITKDGISAGDKKITDVADGDITPTSKDAINGSQLYKLASNTISLGGDNSTVTATQQLNKNGGIKFNIVGDNGIITEAKDDKVIVRVNPSTIGSNITLKYAANGANDQTVKLSDGLNFQDGNFTKASVDAQGKVKYDTVTQAIAPTADGKAQVAPGSTPGLATSADVVNAINNSGWKATAGGNVTGTATSTLVKNGQEVEFNAGDNLKVKQTIDPTTGKQTYEYSLNKDLTGLNSAEFTNAAGDKTKITAGNTEYTNAAGDKTVVNADGLTISSSTPGAKDISVTKDGISAGDKVIKNVAAGVNDTDAVNVSQLKDVDNKITNVNNTINKGLNFKGNTGATVNKQLGDTLEIVGEGTKADSEYSGQNLKVVEDGGKLVVKMDKNLKSDTVTADTVNTNSVTVGAPGKDGVITVKDANGKDGVSINGKDGSIGLNGKDGSSATISTVQGNPGVAGTPGTTMDRIQYTDNSGTPHQVATLDDGMKYGGDTGAVINKKLNQQVNVVGGITDVTKLAANDNIGVISDGSNNLKVRLAKDLDGLETVTVRDASGNTTVVKGDGVTITSPSGNTVSLSNQGLDNGGNVITNVAAGKDGTDAVNVDQLNQTVGNVVNAAGDAIAHVNNKVDKLGDRVNKGLAGAAAMAGLEFMDIGINQATVAAAVGGYRGTHAVAVGIQAAPTENTRVNAKVSMTPGRRTETMYSVGASYRFNWR